MSLLLGLESCRHLQWCTVWWYKCCVDESSRTWSWPALPLLAGCPEWYQGFWLAFMEWWHSCHYDEQVKKMDWAGAWDERRHSLSCLGLVSACCCSLNSSPWRLIFSLQNHIWRHYNGGKFLQGWVCVGVHPKPAKKKVAQMRAQSGVISSCMAFSCDSVARHPDGSGAFDTYEWSYGSKTVFLSTFGHVVTLIFGP